MITACLIVVVVFRILDLLFVWCVVLLLVAYFVVRCLMLITFGYLLILLLVHWLFCLVLWFGV